MATWIATKDSFGYQNKFWKKGDRVTATKQPNDHFKVVSTELEKAQAAADAATKTALAKQEAAKKLAEAEALKKAQEAADKISGQTNKIKDTENK